MYDKHRHTHIHIWVLLQFIGMRGNVTALNTEGPEKEPAPGQRQRLHNDTYILRTRMRNGDQGCEPMEVKINMCNWS